MKRVMKDALHCSRVLTALESFKKKRRKVALWMHRGWHVCLVKLDVEDEAAPLGRLLIMRCDCPKWRLQKQYNNVLQSVRSMYVRTPSALSYAKF